MAPLRPRLSLISFLRCVPRLNSLKPAGGSQLRLSSGSTTSTAEDFHSTFKASPSPAPPKRPRSLFIFIWGTTFICVGLAAGHIGRSFVAPPPFPESGSQEDRIRLEVLRHDIDSLDVIKSMRAEGYHLHSDTALNESSKGRYGWRELDFPVLFSDPSASKHKNEPHTLGDGLKSGGEVTRTLTQKTMAGSGGLGIQRAFWNPVTRELIAVVYFGGRLSGWPGLVHGGAIATVFEDGFSRVVAGPDTAIGGRFDIACFTLELIFSRRFHPISVLTSSYIFPPYPSE